MGGITKSLGFAPARAVWLSAAVFAFGLMPRPGMANAPRNADPAPPSALVAPTPAVSQASLTGTPVGAASVGVARISISRAADLVGSPIRIVHVWAGGQVSSLGNSALGPFGSPLPSLSLTSGFGMRNHPLFGQRIAHAGVDLSARMGTPIYASSNGVVERAGSSGGYGIMVDLSHGGGVETRYAHISRLNVRPGQLVHKGDVIGFVGSTGNSTGPHLHFEVRQNGRATNPLPYLQGRR